MPTLSSRFVDWLIRWIGLESRRKHSGAGDVKMPDYPTEWPEIAKAVKDLAGWRCRRCLHPHETPSNLVDCDRYCDPIWHPETWELIPLRRQRILTVHHLDGRKLNMAHWNLAALCQVCHLFIQGITQHRMDIFYERKDFMATELWLRPYKDGWTEDMGISVLAQNYAPPDYWLKREVPYFL